MISTTVTNIVRLGNFPPSPIPEFVKIPINLLHQFSICYKLKHQEQLLLKRPKFWHCCIWLRKWHTAFPQLLLEGLKTLSFPQLLERTFLQCLWEWYTCLQYYRNMEENIIIRAIYIDNIAWISIGESSEHVLDTFMPCVFLWKPFGVLGACSQCSQLFHLWF